MGPFGPMAGLGLAAFQAEFGRLWVSQHRRLHDFEGLPGNFQGDVVGIEEIDEPDEGVVNRAGDLQPRGFEAIFEREQGGLGVHPRARRDRTPGGRGGNAVKFVFHRRGMVVGEKGDAVGGKNLEKIVLELLVAHSGDEREAEQVPVNRMVLGMSLVMNAKR